MSSLTNSLSISHGPLLLANVGVSPQRSAALQAAGAQVPAMQTGTFLIDTGASNTCIDPVLINALGISPKDYVTMQTPSTNGNAVQCPIYDVQFIFSGVMNAAKPIQIPHVRAISVVEAQLVHQGIHGLIGRDILEHCVLIYNGHTNSYTLAW